MIERTIIPGPPGTGKTYRLVNTYLKKEKEEYNTPLKKLDFLRSVKMPLTFQWDELPNYSIKLIMMKI